MRTQDEIRERYTNYNLADDEPGARDFLGWRREALGYAMSRQTAQEFAKPKADLTQWPENVTEDYVAQAARDYLKFAIDKAFSHRGISASRSIEKFDEWLWVLDDSDLIAAFQNAEYGPYGAPKLNVLIQKWSVDLPFSHVDSLSAWERMIQGLSCKEGCLEGCQL